jgi:hypothetical protein
MKINTVGRIQQRIQYIQSMTSLSKDTTNNIIGLLLLLGIMVLLWYRYRSQRSEPEYINMHSLNTFKR